MMWLEESEYQQLLSFPCHLEKHPKLQYALENISLNYYHMERPAYLSSCFNIRLSYQSVCPSGGPSVRQSVSPSVRIFA